MSSVDLKPLNEGIASLALGVRKTLSVDNASGGEVLREVKRTLRGISGITGIWQPLPEDLRRILKLEKEGEEKALMGMAKGFNEGLREVLKRQVVLAVAFHPELRRPSGPTVILKSGGEVVGEDVSNSERLKELKERSEVLFISENFVIYKDKLKRSTLKDMVVLFPPLSFPKLGGVNGVKDVVSAWPTVPVDLYIKGRAGWNTSDPKSGTMLIGFNLRMKNGCE